MTGLWVGAVRLVLYRVEALVSRSDLLELGVMTLTQFLLVCAIAAVGSSES